MRHTVYVVARIPRYIEADTWVEAAKEANKRVTDTLNTFAYLPPDFVAYIRPERVEEWEDINFERDDDPMSVGRELYMEETT